MWWNFRIGPCYVTFNSSQYVFLYEMELQIWMYVCMYYGSISYQCFRYINHVGKIFTYILGVLGAKAFDGPPVLDNRLIDLYHGDVGSPTQQRITEDFGKAGSSLRVLFSTVGFGMGVDIPDIDRIVHWGVSQSVLFYWQEVGRAGRDNRSSKALLYITAKSVVAEETKPDMKAMVDDIKQGRCVRRAVLERFCRSSSATGEEGMPGVADSAGCTCRNCTCCSVCCDACPCWPCYCSVNKSFSMLRFVIEQCMSHSLQFWSW